MKNTFLAISIAFLSGCFTVYNRCPGTNARIESTYQCTAQANDMALVIMFPQIIGPDQRPGINAWNIATVPLGCLFYVDVICEAAIDTICWPIDKAISDNRKMACSNLVEFASCEVYNINMAEMKELQNIVKIPAKQFAGEDYRAP